MMRPESLRPVILALCAAALAGCLGLGKGTMEPARFYLLAPLSAQGGRDAGGPSIGVGPVTLPEYLNRPQVVTRVGGNEIHLADFARWGEPLKDHVPRVLAENLSALLGTDRVRVFPWSASDAVDCQVVVDVLRFDAEESGVAVLSARWTLLGKGAKEPLRSKRSTYTEPAAAKGYDALVAAESRALQGLGREIATAVRELSAGAGTR